MSATERAYRTIGGVPLWYLRGGRASRGVTVYSQRSFEQKLDAFSFELQRLTPRVYGRVLYVATAGAYVNRPGAHGLGRAFDLDVVRWRNRTSAPYWGHHRSPSGADRRRYLAVDALLRRRFKYVLDGWFNTAHTNHIHVDDLGGALVLSKRFRSDTVFVQAVCNNFLGTPPADRRAVGSGHRACLRRDEAATARRGADGELLMAVAGVAVPRRGARPQQLAVLRRRT